MHVDGSVCGRPCRVENIQEDYRELLAVINARRPAGLPAIQYRMEWANRGNDTTHRPHAAFHKPSTDAAHRGNSSSDQATERSNHAAAAANLTQIVSHSDGSAASNGNATELQSPPLLDLAASVQAANATQARSAQHVRADDTRRAMRRLQSTTKGNDGSALTEANTVSSTEDHQAETLAQSADQELDRHATAGQTGTRQGRGSSSYLPLFEVCGRKCFQGLQRYYAGDFETLRYPTISMQ